MKALNDAPRRLSIRRNGRMRHHRLLRWAVVAGLALGFSVLGAVLMKHAFHSSAALPSHRLDGSSDSNNECALTDSRQVVKGVEEGQVSVLLAPTAIVRLVDEISNRPVQFGCLTEIGRSGVERRSNESGEVELDSSALDARLKWRASADGYFTQELTGQELINEVASKRATIKLRRSGRIVIQLLNWAANGMSVATAEVQIADQVSQARRRWEKTWPVFLKPGHAPHESRGASSVSSQFDVNGRYEVDGIPVDVPVVVVVRGPFDPMRKSARIPPDRGELAVVFEVGSPRGCALAGRMVWDDGAAVKSVAISVRADADAVVTVGSNQDGTFRIEQLPSGVVAWWLDFPGEAVRRTELKDGITDVGDIVLPRLQTLGVQLVCEPSMCWPTVEVWAQSERLIGQRCDRKTGFGEFRVPKGTYSLRVMTGDTTLAALPVAVPGTVTIDLSRSYSQVSFSLDNLVSVGDLAVDLFSCSQANGGGRRFTWSNSTVPSIVGSNGTFHCYGVPPGVYDILLRQRDQTLGVIYDVECQGGATADLGRVSSEVGFVVGVVEDVAGEPIEGVRLRVEHRMGRTLNTPGDGVEVVSNKQGRFRTGSLIAGSYIIRPLGLGHDNNMCSECEVTNGQVAEVTVRLDRPTTVRGRVVGIQTSTETVNTYMVPSGEGYCARYRQVTDVGSDGLFEFANVIPGEYEIVVTCTSRQLRLSEIIQVTATGVASVTFDLSDRATALRFYQNGIERMDIVTVVAVQLTRSERTSRRSGRDFRASLVAGPVLFVLEVASPLLNTVAARTPEHLYAVSHVAGGEDSLDVHLDGGRLIVVSGAISTPVLPPRAAILSVEGLAWRLGGGILGQLHRELDPEGWMFSCLPSGARIRLWDLDDTSRLEVVIPPAPDGEVRVEWPPR